MRKFPEHLKGAAQSRKNVPSALRKEHGPKHRPISLSTTIDNDKELQDYIKTTLSPTERENPFAVQCAQIDFKRMKRNVNRW